MLQVSYVPAAILYALLVAGILFFVIIPSADSSAESNLVFLLRAAFFGLLLYATYDLTNLATLPFFSPKLAVVDIIWGIVVTTVVSSVGLYIFKLF